MRRLLLSAAFLAGCYAPHPNMTGDRTIPLASQPKTPQEQTPTAPLTSADDSARLAEEQREAGQQLIELVREWANNPLGQPAQSPQSQRSGADRLRGTQSAEERRREALEIARIYSLETSLNRSLERKAKENLQDRLNMPAEQRAITPQEMDGALYLALQGEISSTVGALAELYCTEPERFASERQARIAELEQRINGYTGYGLSTILITAEHQDDPDSQGNQHGQPAQPAPAPLPRYVGREEREARMRLADLRRRLALCQSQYESGRINQVNYDSSSRMLNESIRELEQRLPE